MIQCFSLPALEVTSNPTSHISRRRSSTGTNRDFLASPTSSTHAPVRVDHPRISPHYPAKPCYYRQLDASNFQKHGSLAPCLCHRVSPCSFVLQMTKKSISLRPQIKIPKCGRAAMTLSLGVHPLPRPSSFSPNRDLWPQWGEIDLEKTFETPGARQPQAEAANRTSCLTCIILICILLPSPASASPAEYSVSDTDILLPEGWVLLSNRQTRSRYPGRRHGDCSDESRQTERLVRTSGNSIQTHESPVLSVTCI